MGKMNEKLHDELEAKMEGLMLAGNFPSVEFKKIDEAGFRTKSYNMLEYVRYWTRFAKLAHEALCAKGYLDGAFTSNRKNRNAIFLADCAAVAAAITPEQVMANLDNRFRGFMD